MKTPLTLDNNASDYQIRAFAPGQIRINDDLFTKSIIIAPRQLISPWRPQSINELTTEDLTLILPLKPTIVLIGTGSTLVFPPEERYGALINQQIGVEIMNTAAACRTWNALSAENRHVVAALILR